MVYYYLTAFLLAIHSLVGWAKVPTPAMQEAVAPYLLPPDHPAKEVLDAIFSKRVSLDTMTLEKAGFVGVRLLHGGQTIARHPALPGFFFKFVVDRNSQTWIYGTNQYRKQDEYLEFTARIQNRNELERLIEKHQIRTIILPKKWIYPIPPLGEQPAGTIKKFYLLLAEDMHILSFEENTKRWRTDITKEHLDELYLLITEAKLSDVNTFNIAFCEGSDTLAFVDTKPHPPENMNFEEITPYLNPEMVEYWHALMNSLRQ